MRGTILLNHNENTAAIEKEEQSRFLRGFLEQCFESAPDVINQIGEIWQGNGTLPVTQKIKLRSILTTYGIVVKDNNDGQLDIYLDNEIMGSFKKPFYKLHRDLTQIDRNKQFYLEMNIECWTAFDEAGASSEEGGASEKQEVGG